MSTSIISITSNNNPTLQYIFYHETNKKTSLTQILHSLTSKYYRYIRGYGEYDPLYIIFYLNDIIMTTLHTGTLTECISCKHPHRTLLGDDKVIEQLKNSLHENLGPEKAKPLKVRKYKNPYLRSPEFNAEMKRIYNKQYYASCREALLAKQLNAKIN